MSNTVKPRPRKSKPKFSKSASARERPKLQTDVSTAIVGVDLSLNGIALAAIHYDVTLRKIRGPGFHRWRWEPNTHYFDRISDVVRGENFLFDVLAEVKFFGEIPDVFVAVEEPWPIGMVGRVQSNALKQQAEISGAFLGGLLRYGVKNIFQIQANSWRKLVADELGITIHHSKWKDPELCDIYNCLPANTGKFRAKQWALQHDFSGDVEIPDLPDVIKSKQGSIPRPEGSKAKAIQCADEYDALAMMEWMRREWERGLDN